MASVENTFDTIVVGAGLIGAAAVRHLSLSHQEDQRIAIIGPEEPSGWEDHTGVFGSHYDQGRITRVLDDDLVWAILAKRSMERYAEIEEQSEIRFHDPVGVLQVGSEERISQLVTVGRDLDVDFTYYEPGRLAKEEPLFEIPDNLCGVREAGPAGYVNPRSLVCAQLKIAEQNGVSIIRRTIVDFDLDHDNVELCDDQGDCYRAQKVLLAMGAFINKLVSTDQHVDLKIKPQTIALLEPKDIKRFDGMPALIYSEESAAPDDYIYLLPPISYPEYNDTTYLKIGGLPNEKRIETDALGDWFRQGGDSRRFESLQRTIRDLIPGFDAESESSQMKACVTAETRHGYPYVCTLQDDRISVACGGCGSAAKSSDEIGRLAAQLVAGKPWDPPFKALFRAKRKA